jgi:YidC/Oxa1 family membrane protein insertase
VRLTTDRLDIRFSSDDADLVTWRACAPSCALANAGSGLSISFVGAGDSPGVRLVLRGGTPPVDLRAHRSAAVLGAHDRTATLQSELDGVRLVKTFEISEDGYAVAMTASLMGPNAMVFMAGRSLELDIGVGHGLQSPPAAGVASMLERIDRVVVGGSGVRVIGDKMHGPIRLGAGDWAGVRNRFWTLLVRSESCAVALDPLLDKGVVLIAPAPSGGGAPCRYTFYAGPIEARALARADPHLERLLFSGLWSWLRPVSFALLWLLRWLTLLIGHAGVSIVALAVSVKILLLPLTRIAERLQEQVNTAQARLQPGIDAIKVAYRGEERTRRTIALYREHGVHPLYALKSLAGFLIQLPVFLAVFDMLAEDFDLQRASFLWIPNLSRPDALFALPFCIPFFGCELNALPFLMSGVSLATVLRFRSAALSGTFAGRQRRTLCVVTLLFFLLFYTFPAGMVLYWTSTNAVQFLAQEAARWWRQR